MEDGVWFLDRDCNAKCLYIWVYIQICMCISICAYRYVYIEGIYGRQGGVRGENVHCEVPIYVCVHI